MIQKKENILEKEILKLTKNKNEIKDYFKDLKINLYNHNEEIIKILTHQEICSIIDDALEDFSYQIKQRGEDYYINGYVSCVKKKDNEFIAKVEGNEVYDVEIRLDELEPIFYTCSCPCNYPCKHQYAVMLAIKNGDYSEVKLKEYIDKIELPLEEIITLIPAEEIKEYILKEKVDYINFKDSKFKNYFLKYYPRQTYDYYYNNIYNYMVFGNFREVIYINKVKNLINSNQYEESFNIIKAIIEASNDTKRLEIDTLEYLSTIGMLLRIIYRKSNYDIKLSIDTWLDYLRDNNYYNNMYLEDIALTIRIDM